MTTNLLLLYLKIPIISAPDTLIGRSTPPTTSKITLPTNEVNNKSGQAEPIFWRNKMNMTIYDNCTDMDEDGNFSLDSGSY